MARRNWTPIIERARDIVGGYTYLITLRQLHYRLVAEASGVVLADGSTFISGYRNNGNDYDSLSRLTAIARRDGWFPDFIDQTRTTSRLPSWASPKAAVLSMARQYHVDRTEGQKWQIVLGGEKATLLAQLSGWFRNMGVPIVLLRGYSSQTYVDSVRRMVEDDGRDAVLIYAGDFDASGVDILRDFAARCPVFKANEHVATLPGHIRTYTLPVNQGKGEDSRAEMFRRLAPRWARYADQQVASGAWPAQYRTVRGKPPLLLPNVVQVETEAIEPDDLRRLYQAAIDTYWDVPTYEATLVREEADRKRLEGVAKRMR